MTRRALALLVSVLAVVGVAAAVVAHQQPASSQNVVAQTRDDPHGAFDS